MKKLILSFSLCFIVVFSLMVPAFAANDGMANNYNGDGNGNNYRATATGNDDGTDWGWLGLAGLIGLAGLRGRNRERS